MIKSKGIKYTARAIYPDVACVACCVHHRWPYKPFSYRGNKRDDRLYLFQLLIQFELGQYTGVIQKTPQIVKK